MLFPLGRLLQLLGRRVVVDYRDLVPELVEMRYGSRERLLRLVGTVERLSIAYADHVVVTNETTAKVAVERCGIDPARLTVVRSGPEFSGLVPAATAPPGGGIRVGYVGKMAPQDGIDNVVRAAARVVVQRCRDDISFVCVGTGSELERARRLASDLGVDGAIEFTGRLDRPDALARLATCDICIQPDPPSSFNDSCTMIKTLEYMALGKPVVAFDLVETRVSCGSCALYATGGSPAELGDMIIRLADDPSLRERLGAEGRRRVDRGLAWGYGEERLFDVYDGLTRARDAAR